jgi:hypothetical protein
MMRQASQSAVSIVFAGTNSKIDIVIECRERCTPVYDEGERVVSRRSRSNAGGSDFDRQSAQAGQSRWHPESVAALCEPRR